MMSKSSEHKSAVVYTYAGRVLLNAAAHPFEYAKVLIQIGFEPIPPKPTTTFFGKAALKLPNIIEYVRYIKTTDGLMGCYRGVVPKVCGNIVGIVATDKIMKKYNEIDKVPDDELDAADNEESMDPKTKYFHNLKRDVVVRVSSIVVSHPFHVITVRIMAQFVGGEEKYSGIFGSALEIYRQNGFAGFFSGLIPRVVGDILYTFIAATLTYVLNTYVCQDESEFQNYVSTTMTFLAGMLTYPFQVVSNCMAVSNSGLAAGSLPHMPSYSSWVDCWYDLSQRSQLKRGSSAFIRYYTGPHIVIAGKPVPVPPPTAGISFNNGSIAGGMRLKY